MMVRPALIQSLTDQLQESLPPARFLHVLGVAHTAADLAARNGVDPSSAVVAALLHDISKELPPEEIARDMEIWGVPLAPEDLPHPALWHGFHAAELAARRYDLTPEDGLDEIAGAVRVHSTSDAGIGRLGRILYVADSLEPSRAMPGIGSLRDLARSDLEGAYRQTLSGKAAYLASRGIAPHPRAVRALHEFSTTDRAMNEKQNQNQNQN